MFSLILLMSNIDLRLNLDSLKALEDDDIKVDVIKFQKMLLLYNAMEQGWAIKKRNDSYVFSKSHEGKKEVLEESYLYKFMKSNLDISKVIS
jgi:hypothetical protein